MDQIGKPAPLIAVSPQDTPLVHEVLGDEFNLLVCHSFQRAKTLLAKDISLVTCGVHFDQGRMFDVLRLFRSRLNLHDVPFLLALGREVKYSPAILQAIETAAESLGATALSLNTTSFAAMPGPFLIRFNVRKLRRCRLLSTLAIPGGRP
jgi:hypothetical protein